MMYLKLTALTGLTLFSIVCIEMLVLMFTTGTVVNTFDQPIFNNLDFLWLLIKSNPWNGFLQLIEQPVLIIGHTGAATNDYLVALYYYPVSSLLHLGLALLITTRILKYPTLAIRAQFIIGCVLFLLPINYVWLAGCCGAKPGWTLDTLFLNFVLSTDGSPITHMDIYEVAYGWMHTLQLIIMILAGSLLWRATSKLK